MPSTFAPYGWLLLAAGREPNAIYFRLFGLFLLAAGREPSGFSRPFYHVTGRLAPFRYKADGIGREPSGTSLRFRRDKPGRKQSCSAIAH